MSSLDLPMVEGDSASDSDSASDGGVGPPSLGLSAVSMEYEHDEAEFGDLQRQGTCIALDTTMSAEDKLALLEEQLMKSASCVSLLSCSCVPVSLCSCVCVLLLLHRNGSFLCSAHTHTGFPTHP